MVSIEQLTSEQEWRAFYPVVDGFWPVDTVNQHVECLRTMTAQGYRAFGLTTEQPVAFAGVYVLTSPWYGTFTWLVDLVTHQDHRGEGCGTRLYEAVETWSREQGCETIVLASGVERTRAHQFYEHHGFEATEYWFEKSLVTD
ncbi:GNAT family N-acetyltransferase [Halocatena marina]|uniref:GNAT family N-acetyltransferase n=1 Tax=Halocatena marina TaxID=2934937 RepID=UPI0020108649|nr:GNAT family N-acetyltransferase [Halocatena marina]